MDSSTASILIIALFFLGLFLGKTSKSKDTKSVEETQQENKRLQTELDEMKAKNDSLTSRVKELEEQAGKDADVLHAFTQLASRLTSIEKTIVELKNHESQQDKALTAVTRSTTQAQKKIDNLLKSITAEKIASNISHNSPQFAQNAADTRHLPEDQAEKDYASYLQSMKNSGEVQDPFITSPSWEDEVDREAVITENPVHYRTEARYPFNYDSSGA